MATRTSLGTSPVRLSARLDDEPSRWLWLVKWLLLIPHYIVLAVLYMVGFVVTVIAFFAILFTGRYPRSLFDFNVGVLRWSWRVGFYGYCALGTDRYPPFSLGVHADYPTALEVPYPERLSRGLVLVKWWLLAIPHYIVLGILGPAAKVGLITLFVIVAAVVVLFTGRYPSDLFNLVMGLNRWVYRVLVYVLLMRDEYPPFRLDMGGAEPGSASAAPSTPPLHLQPRPFGV